MAEHGCDEIAGHYPITGDPTKSADIVINDDGTVVVHPSWENVARKGSCLGENRIFVQFQSGRDPFEGRSKPDRSRVTYAGHIVCY